MPIPKGYEVVEEIPAGYEPVEESMGVMDTLGGVGNIIGSAGVGMAKQSLEGLSSIGGMMLGRGVDQSVEAARGMTSNIPDVPLGENAQNVINSLSEKYQAAPEVIKDIVSSFMNVGQNLGDVTMETFGSPSLAAQARILPDAMLAASGMKALKGVPVQKIAKTTGKAIDTAGDVTRGALKYQGPAKQRIGRLLQEGSTDIDTAKFKLAQPVQPIQKGIPRLAGPTVKPSAKTGPVSKFLDIGGPKVKPDKIARETIKQGFDEGVVASLKSASPLDKKKMLKMVDIMETSKRNALKGVDHRASDIAGDSLMARVRAVTMANKKSGSQLDGVAKSLKGQRVDSSSAVDKFLGELDDMGISVSDDLKLGFKGSDIEGLAGPERVLSQVFNRMKNTKAPSAYDVHRMKRFIDEQVTYGKSAEGLGGKAESVLKNLRRNLDGILDKKFPEYDKVNSIYSETRGVLDSLQDVTGKKMNLAGPNADKAVGTLMRRLMGNAQSRITLKDAINDIETIARKHGGKFDDNLKMQILFADELDNVFGPAARTSFHGQIKQAVKGVAGAAVRPADTAIEAVAHTADKARGINQENAFKAIRKLMAE